MTSWLTIIWLTKPQINTCVGEYVATLLLYFKTRMEIYVMNKTEMITAMASKTEFTKIDTEKALAAFMDIVKEELVKGEKVQLVGFGTFEVAERAERQGRNPQTGKSMIIPASKSPKFKAGKALKDAIKDT